MIDDIVIIGAGGLAQEVLWTIKCINESPAQQKWRVVAFVSEVSSEWGTKFHGISVIKPSQISTKHAVMGFANPTAKRKFVEKNKKLEYPNIIHPDVLFAMGASTGNNGVVIFARTTLMPFSKVGNFTQINTGVVIGHDTVIGEYNTISPGALIMGNCKTGDCTYIGVGVATREKINIGKECVVGANAAVVSDISDYTTAVGVPAKAIKARGRK
ncbi:MAG: hypothetical protein LLG05_12580 [Porphyromonadaceae bacterium]|nr:hypothetical protein [Porphyromonadaceae bacterium]